MSLLTAHNLGKSFGPIDIFSEISFTIPHRARIGLVGVNGVGKTTLLRILVGLEEASEGSVQLARGTTRGLPAAAPQPGYPAHDLAGMPEVFQRPDRDATGRVGAAWNTR